VAHAPCRRIPGRRAVRRDVVRRGVPRRGDWTPPLKLLDGLWFGVDGTWLPPATTFTSGYGYTRFAIPSTACVSVARTDAVPDGRRAPLVRPPVYHGGRP